MYDALVSMEDRNEKHHQKLEDTPNDSATHLGDG